MFDDFQRWPQEWPWVLIIPIYLFVFWFIFGVSIAFYYWIKRDNEKAKKWFLYSLAALMVALLAWWIWHGVKTGKWFEI